MPTTHDPLAILDRIPVQMVRPLRPAPRLYRPRVRIDAAMLATALDYTAFDLDPASLLRMVRASATDMGC